MTSSPYLVHGQTPQSIVQPSRRPCLASPVEFWFFHPGPCRSDTGLMPSHAHTMIIPLPWWLPHQKPWFSLQSNENVRSPKKDYDQIQYWLFKKEKVFVKNLIKYTESFCCTLLSTNIGVENPPFLEHSHGFVMFCLFTIQDAVKSPKSPWNHHEITMKSRKSPSNHHSLQINLSTYDWDSDSLSSSAICPGRAMETLCGATSLAPLQSWSRVKRHSLHGAGICGSP